MDSLDTSADAMAFLKSKRTEDTEEGTPEVSEEVAEEEAEEEVESEADLEPSVEDDEEESYYVEIDGKQITLDEIRESLGSKFRQSDYTQKTQQLAEQRRALEAREQAAEAKQKELDERIAEAQSLLKEQEESINWDELLEDDPSAYLREQQKLAKRKKTLEEARAKRQKELDAERQKYLSNQVLKLRELAPDWVDDTGQFTDDFGKQLPDVQKYLVSRGLSQEFINQVAEAGLWAVFKDGFNYNQIKSKKPALDNELKRAPKVLKPKKGNRKAPVNDDLEEAKKRLAKTGSKQDALAYLKARKR